MAAKEFTFKFRRGLASEWTSRNPLLSDGEPGAELDTGRIKIGNGADYWNDLPYLVGESGDTLALNNHINSPLPHPIYDDGPSLALLYENSKV